MTIMAKVIVRTRTIDLKVLLGGADAVGKGICADEDGSLNFSMEPLLFDRVVVATTLSDMIVSESKVAKW